MRTLKLISAVLGALYAMRGDAVPFHGCSFFQGRLLSESVECAQLKVDTSCTIVHCALFVCVMYPGAHVTGWFPDYFIEVNNRAGDSLFSSVDAPVVSAQMAAAGAAWTDHGPSAVKREVTGAEQTLYFGRTLPVPYGAAGWSFGSLGLPAPGTPAPTCMLGISEYAADTWADTALSGDRTLAALWAPLTAPACTLAAPLAGAIQSLPISTGTIPASNACAVRLTPWNQEALALSGATALDPMKQCMGVLGGVLPRTGWTDGDEWTASQRVGWRIANMTDEYFRTGVGIQGRDKWQLVWPPIAFPSCFAPGSLIRPSTFDPLNPLVRTPGNDRSWVYAVWRYREACMEPVDYPAAAAEILSYPAIHAAACVPMNAATAAPTGAP
jgi:hypothetical protein